MELFLNDKLGKITLEVSNSQTAKAILILAHGAGAGMHHPFMTSLADAITDQHIHTARFNFPYIEKGRKAPGSPKDAITTWEHVIKEVERLYPGIPIFISGKSYGGRMGSHLLADFPDIHAQGIIYFGFPLHAPGRDSKDRAAHLPSIKQPQLFIQGTKDKLANFEMISEVANELGKAELVAIEHGDHSFNTPKSAGIPKEEMILKLAKTSTEWINKQLN